MIIIITAAMSILFLKRILYRHHISSIATIFLGIVLVGLAYLLKDSDDGTKTGILGIVLLLIS